MFITGWIEGGGVKVVSGGEKPCGYKVNKKLTNINIFSKPVSGRWRQKHVLLFFK